MASEPGRPREELLEFTYATFAVPWLLLAALIALEAFSPGPTPTRLILLSYGPLLIYALACTFYAWRHRDRAGWMARWTIPLDTALIVIGMWRTAYAREFLSAGLLVDVISGLLTGYVGANAVAAVLLVAQYPFLRASIFAPDQWPAWGITAFSLLAAGNAAAAASARLAARGRLWRTLVQIQDIVTSGTPVKEGATAIMQIAAAHFRADSGSLMFFDPHTERLEILSAHHLNDAYQQAQPRLGEGIAGWVAQEGRALLLTPSASVPFRLSRHEIRSSMCVPIAAGGHPLGVLNLNRVATARRFHRDDLEAAEAIAHHAAGLLLRAQHERTLPAALTDLARAHARVSHAVTRDPAVLWPVLLDVARSLTAARFAVLALEREDTGNLDIVAVRGIDGTAARDLLPGLLAATTQGTIHIDERPTDTGAWPVACVPLGTDALRIGAIGLGLSPHEALPRPLLNAVAAHIAAAVHTARTAHRVADIGVVEERRRIAREIHDGVAQTLAEALLQTDLSSVATQSNPAHLATDLKELRTLLERAAREFREFMAEFRQQTDIEGGLCTTLEALAKEFERRYNLPVTLVATGDDAHLPSAVRHAILAIARQALVNVRTHARATHVTIRAEVTEPQCTVSITDDGVGFDLVAYRARPPAPYHLGITSMEERASLVGGRLHIDSAPGRGTTVSVHITLREDHE